MTNKTEKKEPSKKQIIQVVEIIADVFELEHYDISKIRNHLEGTPEYLPLDEQEIKCLTIAECLARLWVNKELLD